MKVATSGDPTVAMWAAARYDPSSALRTAWGKLFRIVAWCAAVPSFGLLGWGAVAYARLEGPAAKLTLAYFTNDYVAACGVGLTALFASIALPRIRRRDVPVLFGACVAGVLFLYLPSLLRAWPILRERNMPATAVVPLAFPFALVAVAAAAGVLGKRRKAVGA
ncbi:MAG: hypothetical protein IT452_12555 [Planctomycetia bacterium]|nr:hypothetical protein [Planctomycetia bacterium]